MFPIPKAQAASFGKKNIHTYRMFWPETEKSKYIDLLDMEWLALYKNVNNQDVAE